MAVATYVHREAVREQQQGETEEEATSCMSVRYFSGLSLALLTFLLLDGRMLNCSPRSSSFSASSVPSWPSSSSVGVVRPHLLSVLSGADFLSLAGVDLLLNFLLTLLRVVPGILHAL